MNTLYVYPHYGFGDYVVCYGLVKELAKKQDIVLLVNEHRSKLQIANIRRLYSSIANVKVDTDDPGLYKNVLYIGWDKWQERVNSDPSAQMQKFFYEQAGVPLNLMWDNFYFERDIVKEINIAISLGLEDKEYVFLHDDPGRNLVINRKYIKPGIEVFHLVEHPDISILDTLYLIENAVEVHMTNTGLVSFVDQMNIKHDALYFHKYPRPLPFEQPILRLNWNIII